MVVLTEDSPLTKLVKKGDAAAMAKNKGVETVGDLLELVPRRYVPPNELTDLSEAPGGRKRAHRGRGRPGNDPADAEPSRQDAQVVLADGGGNQLAVTFFNAYGHVGKLQPGARGSSSARSAPTAGASS